MNTPDDFDEAYEGNQSDERYWYWDDSLHTRLAGRIKRMLKGEMPVEPPTEEEIARLDEYTDKYWVEDLKSEEPADYHDDSKERWEAENNRGSWLDFERCAK